MSTPVLSAKTPTQAPSSMTSDRHANPLLTGAPTKSENFGWAAALSIVAAILFMVLCAILYMEYTVIQPV